MWVGARRVWPWAALENEVYLTLHATLSGEGKLPFINLRVARRAKN